MDNLGRMNQALAYMEAHLTEEIEMREVARLAQCSEYHFTRMFSFLAGITLSEYIRRRRLTMAAFDIRHSDLRILDAAVKYGYSSADSFARAFQALHGIPPSEARNPGHSLVAYPRMTFRLTIQGGNEMKYRIVQKEAFRIIGLMKRVPLIYQGVNPEIAAMVNELGEARLVRLKEMSNVEPRGLINASTNFSEGRLEHGELDQYIGAAVDRNTSSPDPMYTTLEVAASEWAVFEAVGPFPETLQNTWGRIYSEWFPSSGYELAAGPEMLWNESKDTSSPTYRSEIWIPVARRKQ
ncbi:GyrI-like domain-containing protein [Paenibacillus sp. HJGM_3]|uniref:AraC family transcriptional regulator n=1 Tax=Paenibacillus sp. HJGM_3 TaxID=3379816 RepID=UPI00385A6B64